MSYTLSEIHPDDHRGMAQVRNLLEQEGIRRDGNLDYTCGIFNDDWELAATGSCFGNTIRCLAVSGRHRGEGLLNQIVSHLVEVQLARGSATCSSIPSRTAPQYLSDLGFYEIVRVPGSLVFMENRRGGFDRYCASLSPKPQEGQSTAGVVMNANPFTLGHRHLVERAARENDVGPPLRSLRGGRSHPLLPSGVSWWNRAFGAAHSVLPRHRPLPHQLRHLPQLLSEGLRYSHSDPGGAGPAGSSVRSPGGWGSKGAMWGRSAAAMSPVSITRSCAKSCLKQGSSASRSPA